MTSEERKVYFKKRNTETRIRLKHLRELATVKEKDKTATRFCPLCGLKIIHGMHQ